MQAALPSVLGPPGPEIADLTHRVAVVTGGAEGIGEAISLFFAKMGAKVIMVNRKEDHGKEAIQRIKAACDKEGKEADIDWTGCDLGCLREVGEVFTSIRNKLDRLDLLVLSAGINSNQFGLDADGIDRHFGVNALGQFYAMNLLYPLMRQTSQSTNLPNKPRGSTRIVFESSEMHRFAPGSEDNPTRGRGCHFGSEEEITEGGRELGPVELYGRSKLAMILYGKALRDKVIKKHKDDIYVLSVHPGTVSTKMQGQWEAAYPGIIGKLAKYLVYGAGRSPEQGAYSALYAAINNDVVEKDWNGFYLNDPGNPGKETVQGADKNLATALWELSERMIIARLGNDKVESWDA